MNSSPKFVGSAPIFAALGDETRLALLAKLCSGGPRSVTELSKGSQVTRQAISHHLYVLTGAGLVRATRAGRQRIYSVEVNSLDDARQCLDQISAGWDRALNRLMSFVELDQSATGN